MDKNAATQIASDAYDMRNKYTAKNGFVIWYDDIIEELSQLLKKKEIHTFIEAYAGTGHLSRILNNMGVKGKGYTLYPSEEEHYGFSVSSKFTMECISDEILEYKNITRVPKEDFDKDLLVLSWVPYEKGNEILEHLKSHKCPEYILHIGEGEGGCTGNTELSEHMVNEYEVVHHFKEYLSFRYIYDYMELLKKKKE